VFVGEQKKKKKTQAKNIKADEELSDSGQGTAVRPGVCG